MSGSDAFAMSDRLPSWDPCSSFSLDPGCGCRLRGRVRRRHGRRRDLL